MRRRLGNILLLGGSAAIVWCLTVLGGAALFQFYEHWRLNRSPRTVTYQVGRPRLHDVVGRLDIPRLHVSTIVIEGDDDRTLSFGAGHVPGTPFPDQPGNVGIAAHRDTFFRPLRHISPNDQITLTTPDGTYRYTVESTEIVHPNEMRVLDAGREPELTLITCYPFYFVGSAPLRFVVHARREG
jgi:sortase A